MRLVSLLLILFSVKISAQSWQLVETTGEPIKRHENSLTSIGSKLYVFGGRGVKPMDVLNTETNVWTTKGETPLEMHHFQAVNYKGEIYVLGAFTGSYPHETPIPNIYIYNPDTDTWRIGAEIPRKRGSAGAFVYNNKIYLVCGIQDGHWDGHVTWFDEYNPETNKWRTLSDAPQARDHTSVAVVGDKLYLAGGRKSHAAINQVLELTTAEVDVFDFKTNTWETLPASANIPTERAGCSAVSKDGKLIIIGGESSSQKSAHSDVEVLNPRTNVWEKLPPMKVTRHGTGATVINGKIYIAAGSLNRGGGPELNSVECLED
jgi:N-acetylneuraminic acid mutarotase